MIHIDNKTASQTVYFPKNYIRNDENLSLKLHSNYTHKDFILSVEDTKEKIFNWSFILDLSNIPDGEYIYNIYSENIMLSHGLIQIGCLK